MIWLIGDHETLCDGNIFGECILCGFRGMEKDHRCTVPTISGGGYELYIDNKRYASDVPSISIADLKNCAEIRSTYQVWQETPGGNPHEWVPLSDSNAIDLRTSPHLWVVPPSTGG